MLALKAQEQLPASGEAQLINYLRASGKKIGMLINFASPKATIRRVVVYLFFKGFSVSSVAI